GRLRYSPDTLLEDLPVSLARLDPSGTVLFANRAARRLLGETGVEGRPFGALLEGLGKPMPNRIADTIAGKSQGRSEVARSLRPGAEGFLQVTMTRMEGPDGPTLLSVLSDATELKTLEAQFVQSQKMQAVGQLAGGIAHDFNNLLTAINGHCDLLLLRHLQGDADHSDLIQIRQNANRAAALVRQLLAFSRKQTLQPQVLNLYDTLAELANLLNRLLGEKVALKIENAEDIWSVRVDERQLEQVIVNLVVNARDAMPTGGVVGLKTEKVTLDVPLERDRAIVPPGDYAVIRVSDSGIGIPKDQIAKIFEPFFTTKKVGEGTGLGLSTAYGIIKQMDGFIFVDSTQGEGSEFSVYLPANDIDAPNLADGEDAPRTKPKAQTGTGVILLAEDEAPVRAFAVRALQMRGYTVLEADCGERALEILEDETVKVDLFVTDVVMPGIDGPSWVTKALETRPNTSTVFISGYSQDTFVDG
ncbi:MAG: ATP-binding protein, partial [Pseudomonadota bacterium]